MMHHPSQTTWPLEENMEHLKASDFVPPPAYPGNDHQLGVLSPLRPPVRPRPPPRGRREGGTPIRGLYLIRRCPSPGHCPLPAALEFLFDLCPIDNSFGTAVVFHFHSTHYLSLHICYLESLSNHNIRWRKCSY